MSKSTNWFPGTEGTHFAGLPVTEGKWVEDRDRHGTLMGWLEMSAYGVLNQYAINGHGQSDARINAIRLLRCLGVSFEIARALISAIDAADRSAR